MTTLPALLAGLGTGLALIVAIGAQNAYLLRLAIGSSMRIILAAVAICVLSDAVLIVLGALGVGAVVERFPGMLVAVRVVGAGFLLVYGVLAAVRAVRGGSGAMRVDATPGSAGVAPSAGHRATAHPGAASAAECDVVHAVPGATTHTAGAVSATRAAPPGRTSTGRTSSTGRTASAGRTSSSPTARVAVLTMLAFTWANPHVYLDTLVFLGSLAAQQGPDLRWWWVTGAVLASCTWFAAIGFGGRALRPVFAKPVSWRVFDACIAVVMLAFAAKLLLGA